MPPVEAAFLLGEPMNIDPLLALIRKYESADDYNRVWSGIAKHDYPPRRLTDMTVREVLSWQDDIDSRYMSEASGAYQIMEDTLRGLVINGAVEMNDRFSKQTQDRLAVHLMKRRGLDKYMRGDMTPHQFADSLAYEWASLPITSGPRKGYSQYAGDGLNKAHVDPDTVLNAVRAIKVKTIKPKKPDGLSRAIGPILEALANLLERLFRGKS